MDNKKFLLLVFSIVIIETKIKTTLATGIKTVYFCIRISAEINKIFFVLLFF